jgi:hypothetical protein
VLLHQLGLLLLLLLLLQPTLLGRANYYCNMCSSSPSMCRWDFWGSF